MATQQLNPIGHAIAAGVSSAITTFLTYPLDLIRTRFQVHDGRRKDITKYRGVTHAFRQIYISEGLRGLYAGVSPSVVGSVGAWSLYMMLYSLGRRELENRNILHGTTQIMLSGVVAGAITAVITNPIWVIKTRLQTQIAERGRGPILPHHYRGTIDAVRKIYSAEGLRAFAKGMVPALLASYHGAVQLTIYENVNLYLLSTNSFAAALGLQSFIAGGVSKLGAMIATHPLGVVKSRLQEQRYATLYSGFIDCFKKIWKNEGLVGMYKGMTPSILRLVLSSSGFFYILDINKKMLLRFGYFRSEPAESHG